MANHIGGVISGVNPFVFNSASPVTFFLIQAALIMVLSNGLHVFISKLRQPKVISEVVAGIILGPTVFGQIPNYTSTMFPPDSVTGLNLVANLGIILFMFFLGMEVDVSFVKRNAKAAVSIGMATLAVPFGFGCLFSLPLYNAYMDNHDTEFKVFMVFIAVSLSITAFPVLCRILTELRLVKERVGIIVLTSGTINDVVGWILLALCIILSNSQSDPVNVVYILLCTFGWFFFCCYPVRLALKWGFKRFHEFERDSPSTWATLVVLVIVLLSAYFTDIIGVHPIFGAFIAGIVIPRENNYVSKLTARMEDVPNLLMIPIYFTIAGLNVDLTLLNRGSDWGYTFASIGIAVATKLVSGSLVSKLNGLRWRESLAVGVLMSCKGIVEIVVLTTGLNAGIITKKVYAMFIFMALISTFITTPLTLWIFPDHYRNELKKQQSDSNIPDLHHASFSRTEDLKIMHFSSVELVINNAKAVALSLWFLKTFSAGQQEWKEAFASDLEILDKKPLHKVLSSDTEAMTVVSDSIDAPLLVNARHLKLMSDRTAEILELTSLYNNLTSADNGLEMIRVFSSLFGLKFKGEVLFSSLAEKVGYIGKISVPQNDTLLLPLNYPTGDQNDSTSRILSFNDLPEDFFATLATKVTSSLILLFGTVVHQQPTSVVIYLINPIMSSSDYMALFLALVMGSHANNIRIITIPDHLPTLAELQGILKSSMLIKLDITTVKNDVASSTVSSATIFDDIELENKSFVLMPQDCISSTCLDDYSRLLLTKASKSGSTVAICHRYLAKNR
ncbi:unnamed protein product [Kluyveromyces dobzhanskii CBS 2104]|uniref:WGS project CCBQ000000000 data, contig 00104 n=1 Tax=Kluyveromyces dobzhanskii CBS 2104 TaxID=1427455 RepID=A0A0A8L3D0_9SACH|nr:unnamed protein product [Kluyveromyces dobzhanskii CBS 2104]